MIWMKNCAHLYYSISKYNHQYENCLHWNIIILTYHLVLCYCISWWQPEHPPSSQTLLLLFQHARDELSSVHQLHQTIPTDNRAKLFSDDLGMSRRFQVIWNNNHFTMIIANKYCYKHGYKYHVLFRTDSSM